MKKNDWILFVFIILLSIALGGIFFCLKIGKTGNTVQITIDGTLYKTVPLYKNREILISGENGAENLLIIEDGQIYMKEANCPNHHCIKQGKTNPIVCLPNKVIVEIIETKEQSALDGITK